MPPPPSRGPTNQMPNQNQMMRQGSQDLQMTSSDNACMPDGLQGKTPAELIAMAANNAIQEEAATNGGV